MTSEIKISDFIDGEECEISSLVKTVFDEFVAPGYSKEGNEFFYKHIDPSAIKLRLRDEDRFILTAKSNEQIIGVIEFKFSEYVSMLFVDKNYHCKGIAKKLYQEGLKKLYQTHPELKVMKVHASPYSLEAYKKLGFITTDKELEAFGMKYIPMEHQLI